MFKKLLQVNIIYRRLGGTLGYYSFPSYSGQSLYPGKKFQQEQEHISQVIVFPFSSALHQFPELFNFLLQLMAKSPRITKVLSNLTDNS